MSLRNKLRSRFVNLVISEKAESVRRALAEKRRQIARRPHAVTVFLELDDPYSYLLAYYLAELAANFDIELHYCLAQACGDAYRPRADMLAVYAEQDCARVAAELDVPFLDKGQVPPVEHRRALIDTLAGQTEAGNFAEQLVEAVSLYWRGDSEGVARRLGGEELTGAGDRMLDDSRQRLRELGHYNCATLYYEGEWYWGIDRLHYLTERLEALGLRHTSASTPNIASIRQAMQVTLPVAPPNSARDLPALEFFYSFRSPYSYLSLGRVFAIADAFGADLVIRPVLPMVMRGMQIPRSKLVYIAKDTSREARRLDIAFGKFSDPVGAGAERCLAVFRYARSENRERDFLLNAGAAIWAQGIDVATDAGMRKVTGRTGLFWPDVVKAMQDDAWRSEVEANRESMMESGSWGVPTLRLGDFVVWGQDRDWLLVRHIEELCDSGDGILI